MAVGAAMRGVYDAANRGIFIWAPKPTTRPEPAYGTISVCFRRAKTYGMFSIRSYEYGIVRYRTVLAGPRYPISNPRDPENPKP